MWQDLFQGCLHVDLREQTADESRACLADLATCKGVVLFCDEEDRPVQLLIAGNIRRVGRSRLCSEDGGDCSKRADISPIVRRIYHLCCHNDFRSGLRYLEIAKSVFPESWRNVVTLGKLWYVRINLGAEWPNYSATSKVPAAGEVRCFGPFATRKSADRYIGALRSGFLLCQRPDLVASRQKVATCPYLQMNTCPSPCVGRVSREDYMDQVAEAVAAAGGGVGVYIAGLRAQMTEHAKRKEFEEANAVKSRIESLEVLAKDEYRWITDLEKLAILHIDRSARIAPAKGRRKMQTYAAFLIQRDGIVEFDDFTASDTRMFCEKLAQCLADPVTGHPDANVTERLSLAGYYLYRSNPAGLWIDCRGDRTAFERIDRERVVHAICEKWPNDIVPQSDKDQGD